MHKWPSTVQEKVPSEQIFFLVGGPPPRFKCEKK